MPSSKFVVLSQSIRFPSRGAVAAFATAFVFAMAGAVRADDAATQTYPVVCAQHDIKVVTLIDLHGHAQLVAADVLAQAYFEVIKARDACAQGRVEEAVAIYNRLLPGLEEVEGDEIHAAR
jgi:hypothetical protein